MSIVVEIKPSTRKDKKYMAIFTNEDGKTKIVHFGAAGYDDYTITRNTKQRENYINRHNNDREDWDQYDTPGALSRWILWEYEDLDTAIKQYKKKFKLK